MKIIRGVSVTPESIDIAYMDDATDLRADGAVYMMHTLSLGRDDPELAAEVQEMEAALESLLVVGIRRWSTTPPVTPQQINDRLHAGQDMDLDEDDEEEEGQR